MARREVADLLVPVAQVRAPTVDEDERRVTDAPGLVADEHAVIGRHRHHVVALALVGRKAQLTPTPNAPGSITAVRSWNSIIENGHWVEPGLAH